jgi:hypothetical protein
VTALTCFSVFLPGSNGAEKLMSHYRGDFSGNPAYFICAYGHQDASFYGKVACLLTEKGIDIMSGFDSYGLGTPILTDHTMGVGSYVKRMASTTVLDTLIAVNFNSI